MLPDAPLTALLPYAAETALDGTKSDRDLRCPCYCEENVWRLAYRKLHRMAIDENEEYFVIFISNTSKCVAMFHQKASRSPADKPCFWDYHVILVGVDKQSNNAVVYDLDTTVEPYPAPLHNYLARSFDYPDYLLRKTTVEMPLFRVILASTFLEYFESDRSHMYNSQTGEWIAPPPNYQCIRIAAAKNESSSKRRSNLQIYLNFDTDQPISSEDEVGIPNTALGKIMSLDGLKNYDWKSY
jgi:hypothetical protein